MTATLQGRSTNSSDSGDGDLDEAQAEQLASAAAEAATELATTLTNVVALVPEAAQAVTDVVSTLLDVQMISKGSSSSAKAAENINGALNQLARAAAAAATLSAGANGTAEPVVLTSQNLNMSIAIRSASSLAEEPFACDSAAGPPATVALPGGLLDAVDGIDPSLPVAAVLFTTSANLRATPQVSGGGSANTSMSPTVSFSLSQDGVPVEIRDASSPITISIPFSAANQSCTGAPEAYEAAAACGTTVECRFWNDTDGNWSTAGCQTVVGAGGLVSCACNHLTEFIAFEFPTSAEEFLAMALDSISMNGLTQRALDCAFNPSRSWRTVPAVWGCDFTLLLLFVALMTNAVYRDRIEISNVLALLAGKKKDEAREARARLAATPTATTRVTGRRPIVFRRLRQNSSRAAPQRGTVPQQGAPRLAAALARQGLFRLALASSLKTQNAGGRRHSVSRFGQQASFNGPSSPTGQGNSRVQGALRAVRASAKVSPAPMNRSCGRQESQEGSHVQRGTRLWFPKVRQSRSLGYLRSSPLSSRTQKPPADQVLVPRQTSTSTSANSGVGRALFAEGPCDASSDVGIPPTPPPSPSALDDSGATQVSPAATLQINTTDDVVPFSSFDSPSEVAGGPDHTYLCEAANCSAGDWQGESLSDHLSLVSSPAPS